MQIALEDFRGQTNYIRAYQPGSIQVNDKTYSQSIIIAPNVPVALWKPLLYQELTVSDFALIAEFKPQILLLGTGEMMRFPSPELRLAINKLTPGVEYMSTSAACRTYNVLLAENRNVVAALLIN